MASCLNFLHGLVEITVPILIQPPDLVSRHFLPSSWLHRVPCSTFPLPLEAINLSCRVFVWKKFWLATRRASRSCTSSGGGRNGCGNAPVGSGSGGGGGGGATCSAPMLEAICSDACSEAPTGSASPLSVATGASSHFRSSPCCHPAVAELAAHLPVILATSVTPIGF